MFGQNDSSTTGPSIRLTSRVSFRVNYKKQAFSATAGIEEFRLAQQKPEPIVVSVIANLHNAISTASSTEPEENRTLLLLHYSPIKDNLTALIETSIMEVERGRAGNKVKSGILYAIANVSELIRR